MKGKVTIFVGAMFILSLWVYVPKQIVFGEGTFTNKLTELPENWHPPTKPSFMSMIPEVREECKRRGLIKVYPDGLGEATFYPENLRTLLEIMRKYGQDPGDLTEECIARLEEEWRACGSPLLTTCEYELDPAPFSPSEGTVESKAEVPPPQFPPVWERPPELYAVWYSWAGIYTNAVWYRTLEVTVNVPSEGQYLCPESRFNIYTTHFTNAINDDYFEVGVGAHDEHYFDGKGGFYLFTLAYQNGTYGWTWKSIPAGHSRDVFLKLRTYQSGSDNYVWMYAKDYYSGETLGLIFGNIVTLDWRADTCQEQTSEDNSIWTGTETAYFREIKLVDMWGDNYYWNDNVPSQAVLCAPLKWDYGTDNSHWFKPWCDYEVNIGISTLYQANIYFVPLYLAKGTQLRAKFYSYTGEQWGDFLLWTGSTPAWINASFGISLGRPIEVVKLWTDGGGGTVLKTFVVTRDVLWGRLMKIRSRWPYASPSERDALWGELTGIRGQWPYAPVSSSGVTGTSGLEQSVEKSSEVAAGEISHPGGTIVEVAQGQPFLLRYRLNWGEVDVPGFYSIVLHWLNYENKPSENLTFLRAEAYFDNGEAIDNTVTLKATPSGADTAYILTVSNSAGDLRDGTFNVDIWLQAAGEGEVPHEVTDNHPIWHSMGSFSIAESTIVDVAAGSVTVRIPHGSTQIYPDADVYAQGNGQGEFWQSQLKFDINGVPSGVTVDSVKLWLYRFDGWGAGESMYVYKVNDQEWDEAITAGEFDDQTLTNQETRAIGWGSNGWDYVDVVNQFLVDYNVGNNYTTIRLKHIYDDSSASNYIYNTAELMLGSDPGQFWRTFYSRDHADCRPYLEIKYTLPA